MNKKTLSQLLPAVFRVYDQSFIPGEGSSEGSQNHRESLSEQQQPGVVVGDSLLHGVVVFFSLTYGIKLP